MGLGYILKYHINRENNVYPVAENGYSLIES